METVVDVRLESLLVDLQRRELSLHVFHEWGDSLDIPVLTWEEYIADFLIQRFDFAYESGDFRHRSTFDSIVHAAPNRQTLVRTFRSRRFSTKETRPF